MGRELSIDCAKRSSLRPFVPRPHQASHLLRDVRGCPRREPRSHGRPDLDEILEDSTDPDDQVQVIFASAYTLMVAGRPPDAAYRIPAIKPEGLATQYAEGAARPRAQSRDLDWRPRPLPHGPARSSSRGVRPARRPGLPDRRPGGGCLCRRPRATPPRDAIRESIQGLDALGQYFDAAEMALDALILMLSDPEIRRLAEERRPVFERVGARQLLAKLDATLESMPLASPAAAAIAVEAPTSGS